MRVQLINCVVVSRNFLHGSVLLFRGWAPGAVMILGEQGELPRGSWVQLSSVAQSCPTLCYPMNCSTPGLPVHHQLPEFTQTHVVLGYIKSKSWGRFHPLVLDLSPQGPGRSESIFDLSSAIWRQLFPKLSLLSAKMSWLPQLAF